MKYRDTRRLRSDLIAPSPPGEDYRDRHKRRLEFNLKAQEWVAEEAAALGLTLTVTNDGHHWQFRGGDINADWWPSSAKFVLNSNFKRGIHVHDYHAMMKELSSAVYQAQKPGFFQRIKAAF